MADHDSFDPWESTDYFDAEDYASVHNDGTPSNDFSWSSGDSMWNTGSGQAPQGLLGGFDSVGNYWGDTSNTSNTPWSETNTLLQGQQGIMDMNAVPVNTTGQKLAKGLLGNQVTPGFTNTAVPGTTPIDVKPVQFTGGINPERDNP